MPSPITHDDFDPILWNGDACQQFGELFKTNEKLKSFLEWLLASSGELSDAVLDGISDRISPVGIVVPYGGITVPSDRWAFANGQALLRASYPVLFSRLGTTFGAGDGATTFNLPSVTNRMLIGGGDIYPNGSTGGEATHTLTEAEMPTHNHKNGNYSHILQAPLDGAITGSDTSNSPTEANVTTSTPMVDVGGGLPHNNLPPYLAMPAIVRIK